MRSSRVAIGTAVAVVIALAMSAAAPAKKPSYEGPIPDSLGSVEFSLERDEGKLYAAHFHVDDLPYTCPNGTSKTIDFGIRRMRVGNRRFSGSTYFGGGGRRREVAQVVGRLKPRGRAKGTVHYKDTFDAVSVCESGEMGWTARK